jgi:hypothetical protein
MTIVITQPVTRVLKVYAGPVGPTGPQGPGVTVSATPPVSPSAGDWWIDSATLQLYAYYDDGDSSQWVGIVAGTPDNATLVMGTLTYAATVTLDMAAIAGQYRTITLAGNLALQTSNRATGRAVVLRLVGDASSRTLTFPGSWVFLGATAPSALAAGKTAILSITYFGSADSDAVCAYAVQP